MHSVTIAAFYRFVALPDCRELQPAMRERCVQLGIKGTILLAPEGINSTIAGEAGNITEFFRWLGEDARFSAMEYKESCAPEAPFAKMLVKLKTEIVRMKVEGLDAADCGTYVDAASWDELLRDPDVVVVDTRNNYEVEMGRFAGAVNPETAYFSDFPAWAERNLEPSRHKKIAMYCTGGIRCEKSTAYLKSKGFEEVYHLRGGILKYLEMTGNASGQWQGECFVFDDRRGIDAELRPATPQKI